ncbi:hypothetical protein N7486_007126 [Penicillium sp. IBT 16267x]|nr:hypothetical protein N7486_007126 [Penicillium sp. IBT 16267x]
MSKKIIAPAAYFYPNPDNISLEAAALVEPLAEAWHAVNVSPFKVGDSGRRGWTNRDRRHVK